MRIEHSTGRALAIFFAEHLLLDHHQDNRVYRLLETRLKYHIVVLMQPQLFPEIIRNGLIIQKNWGFSELNSNF
jgi:hypothetical protein